MMFHYKQEANHGLYPATFCKGKWFLIKIFKLRGQSVFKNLQVKEYIVMTAHNLKALHSNPDSNRTRTHNLLVCKRTLNHLAKLAK